MGQFGLDDLKLAFSLHVVDQIVAADDQLTRAELAFLESQFPQKLLRDRGFADEDGVRTDAYHQAAMDALDRLPHQLELDEKVALLSVFFAATIADERFEAAEGNALVDAARLLDMTDDEIDRFLASRDESRGTDVATLEAAADGEE
jgi:hypothetical protein